MLRNNVDARRCSYFEPAWATCEEIEWFILCSLSSLAVDFWKEENKTKSNIWPKIKP